MPVVYYNRGIICQVELGNYQAAITDYTEAIKLDLDNVAVYYNRGIICQAELGNYQAAIADCG